MTKGKLSRGNILAIIISSILVLDQFSKIWIKTHFTLHQSVNVLGKWFQLYFVENEGMAFGMVFGGDNGKLILSLFRVALSIFIMWYICRLLKKPDTPMGVLVGLSMVFVGAIGNIIDCAFYGLIFSESGVTEVATMFPPGGGYGSFLHGKVVDMLYFPLIDTVLTENFPIWGGRRFVFFQFIFNVADSAITIGALYLLIFKHKFFSKK
ncbi:MAG TPA: lipoprotein signal peptidase [Bacteroidales bacterium]|nr:MAG: lipoprotein signal peptidase [Bacteroidetes bacterium ADurb.Bin139]HOG25317.1 lipoprotein signal peptidase [Bacteroidales bacterium]HOR11567.1 lipoprotein signal peptidase [Bacteroidales bacterium]HPK38769.1 lipoprotein signal peptidase [Bacteroidales bacterium]HQN81458.1 lipoprotein signal peptidase [Bacteroidales bacterium]